MTTLLVAEKPKVAKRMAEALGDYSVDEQHGVKNYRLEHEGEDYIIAPAVGHIFTLEQAEGDWTYPVFDVEWVPSHTTDDGQDYMKKYFRNLQERGEEADRFINGCDFDVEGSTIGYNVITRACGGTDDRIKRMKFSTLTTSDLVDAFTNLNAFDEGQTNAGLTRHVLDWYYGINISRALMLAVKSQDRFQSLSTGRVQGPALKILADREREIQAFEPDPYWQVVLHAGGLDAYHVDDRFWEEQAADAVLEACRGAQAVVDAVDRNRYEHNVPVPFNLTGLQQAAQRQFGISPKRAQQIAQSLYEDSLISYPRTESQKLPAKIGYEQILSKLGNQDDYADLTETVLDMEDMYPKQGGKTDDAHPAIYPTGVAPSGLSKQEGQLYDLIVKRFLAVFGEPAVRETVIITLAVNGERFQASGKRTLEEHWFALYRPYVTVDEDEMPPLEEGAAVETDGIEKLDKETQPPNRYSQSGIVSELEDRNLGTKATRANIIQSLYDRNYIDGGSIEVTDLGLAVVEALEEHCPEILSEDLTRQFEQDMDAIRSLDATPDDVLAGARDTLEDVLETFQEHEDAIGSQLIDAIDATRRKQNQLGPCDQCDDGTLRIIRKNGKFVGCSNYPDCENTYPLPGDGKIEPLKEECDTCHTPRIKVIRKGRRPFEMCIDPDCPTKDDWD